jgi:hypothetical protein
MKKILLSVIIVFLNSIVLAQSYIDLNQLGEGYYLVNKPSQSKQIDGSPYYNDNWLPAVVKIKGKGECYTDSLKYNIFTNSLLFSYKKIEYYVENSNDVVYFTIGDTKFINFACAEDGSQYFFEVICDGERLKLVRKYNCTIVEGKPSDGINPARNDKFAKDYRYFTIFKYQPAKQFRMRKSNLVELMADHHDEIVRYIKDNRLKMKRQEDFVKVFAYYNTLP